MLPVDRPARCLHQLFAENARRYPDAIAAVCGEQRLSYADLYRRARKVAHHLALRGVGPEVLVGLCAEPSLEMLVAILGIFEAGGAYMPLDPAYPPGRLSHLLADSGVPVVLTCGDAGERLPPHRAAVVALEAIENEASPAPDVAQRSEASPANLAYVIYTSGSTGTPKGVMVSHGDVVRLFSATAPFFRFDTSDVTLFVHSFAFDFSVWEIWGALLHGGRLVVVPGEARRSPPALLDLLLAEGVTVLNQTPSAFTGLARAALSSPVKRLPLRWIILGGEAFAPHAFVPWIERFGLESPRIVNMYGITETTVHVTLRALERSDFAGGQGSPIGGPIPDQRVHLLDARMRPAAPGTDGEIYVGGQGIARGYLGKPALTAERFLPDPFADKPGARLYRSGDLGRRGPDGDIEYRGRLDQQVKIRGFRIEPAEIEAALSSHPDVAEALVVARDAPGEEGAADKRLVAYVAPARTGPGASVADARALVGALRKLAQEALPPHMIPAVIVVLDALPRTASGKLDRSALPPPPRDRPPLSAPYRAPQGPLEQRIAAIFAAVVGVDEIGAHDDFFELGGDSLKAARVVAQLRESLERPLPVTAFFEAPTVAGLATQIALLGEPLRAAPAPPPDAPLPLSPAQQRIWFLHRMAPGHPINNIPAVLRLGGPLDTRALERSLAEVVQRHAALRTYVRASPEPPLQVVEQSASAPLGLADLTDLPAEEREGAAQRLAAEEAERPFDLGRAPLLRATLLRLGPEEHRLLLTMHHIVSDGWSLRILIDELGALYAAFARGAPSPLPPPVMQYPELVQAQRARLEGRLAESLVAYWKRKLAGEIPELDLPTDRPPPPVARMRGALLEASLSPALSEAVGALGRDEGVTPFMVMLAALFALLARYARETDVAVGAPVAARLLPGAEALLGCCFNTVVLRGDLSGSPTIRELLRRVRGVAAGAYAHQELPFDRLVAECNPRREAGRQPFFRVVFNYNDAPIAPQRAAGVEMALLGQPLGKVAKADLELYVHPLPEGSLLWLVYDVDLFEAGTARRVLHDYQTILSDLVARPDARLDELAPAVLSAAATRRQVALEQLAGARRKPLRVPMRRVVETRALLPGDAGPLVVTPAAGGVDLAGWAAQNLDLIQRELLARGAVLFRGFAVASAEDLERVMAAMGERRMRYVEGSSPRVRLTDAVYTSTEYPPAYPISLHNELSYAHRWPSKLFFLCLTPPSEGGETPLADARRALDLLDPETRARFVEKGVRYVRHLHGGRGAGLSWQTVFETDDPAAVESYCREGAIDFRWLPGGGLHTSQRRPAVAVHPASRQAVWFNQVDQWHPSNLGSPMARALAAAARDELPIDATYGDGTPFEPEELDAVRATFERVAVTFPWQARDLLIIDNMLMAHGRRPFRGPRRVLVAMSGAVSLAEAGSAPA